MFSKTEVLNSLYSGIVDVLFQKVDGSLRVMKCTLDPKIVPPRKPTPEKEINFLTMSEAEIVDYCKDDASKWATAFLAHYPENDEAVMTGWFANAIESAADYRLKKAESTLINVWEINVGWRSFDLARVKSIQFANPT